MTQMSVSLSIGIVLFESDIREVEDLFRSLLYSIFEVRKKYEDIGVTIVFINNSSKDIAEVRNLVNTFIRKTTSEKKIEIKLFQLDDNVGYGCGHNIALSSTNSTFHLIINPDILLCASSLGRGIDYLFKNTSKVIVTPKCHDMEGTRQYLCKRFPSVLTLLVRGFVPQSLHQFFRYRLDYYQMRELDSDESCRAKKEDIRIVSGCFMLCRTDALKKVGGFDNRYFLYFEDFDLSLRMSKLGKIEYLPEMKIIHGGGNAAKKGWRHILMFIHSGVRFYNTHGWRWFKQ